MKNGEIFLNGRLRFCFESPIEAGTVMVAAVAWLFLPLLLFPSSRVLRIVVSIMVAVTVACLALTGSRGPILAGFVAFVAVFALGWRQGPISRKALAAPCLTGVCCLAVSLFLFPAGKRMGDMVGGRDDSILNRLELWERCLRFVIIDVDITAAGRAENGSGEAWRGNRPSTSG
jgi:O-antigen ligase